MNIFAIKHLELHSQINLTLAERRLFNYLLHHAIDRLSHQLEFSISFEDLKGVFGCGAPSVDMLRTALIHLLNTHIEFLIEEENNQKWYSTSLLSDIEVDISNNKLIYRYPPTLRIIFSEPILLERCLIQAHFVYKYSVLLYELLAQKYYQKMTDFYVDLDSLRQFIRLDHNKMPNFADFNRTVLRPAGEEINTYAGFTVKFTTENRGRKVIGLHFTCAAKFKTDLRSAKEVIPPMRPQLFIETPEKELAYALILNAETHIRARFFKLAQKRAEKLKRPLSIEELDRPDLWYELVVSEVLSFFKNH